MTDQTDTFRASAEVAPTLLDAARHRWWRDHGYTANSERRQIEIELLAAGECFESIDAAIDAAMAQDARREGTRCAWA